MSICPTGALHRVQNHFEQTSTPLLSGFNFSLERLLQHMIKDKKMADGKLTFVIASGIGKSYLSRDVDMEDVKAVLELGLKG